MTESSKRLPAIGVLIGVLTLVGLAKVALQTQIYLSGYDLGRVTRLVHRTDNETRWMRTKVMALESPIELTKTMREQHVKLVAWSGLAAAPRVASASAKSSVRVATRQAASASETTTQLAKSAEAAD